MVGIQIPGCLVGYRLLALSLGCVHGRLYRALTSGPFRKVFAENDIRSIGA